MNVDWVHVGVHGVCSFAFWAYDRDILFFGISNVKTWEKCEESYTVLSQIY